MCRVSPSLVPCSGGMVLVAVCELYRTYINKLEVPLLYAQYATILKYPNKHTSWFHTYVYVFAPTHASSWAWAYWSTHCGMYSLLIWGYRTSLFLFWFVSLYIWYLENKFTDIFYIISWKGHTVFIYHLFCHMFWQMDDFVNIFFIFVNKINQFLSKSDPSF